MMAWCLSRQQAIIGTNDGKFTDVYMSLGLNELKHWGQKKIF